MCKAPHATYLVSDRVVVIKVHIVGIRRKLGLGLRYKVLFSLVPVLPPAVSGKRPRVSF